VDSVLDFFKSAFYYMRFPLFEVSGSKISIISVVLCICFFIFSIKMSRVAEKMVLSLLEDQELDSGIKGSISRFTKYLVLMTGSLIALDTVGISLKSLAALGAVLMVGIGFGLQNITQNFISGLIILLERPIKVGDLVDVKGVSGKIVDIGARSTLVHTRDDVAIIVPNSQFISEQVTNESFTGSKVRLHLTVGVSYGSDVEKVKTILEEIGIKNSKVLNSPKPQVFFMEFGNSSLDFDLRVWVEDLWGYDEILSELRFNVVKKFNEQNIEIPFPQRDLHIRSIEKGLTLS
jgi:small-conductance mechanosensitive channel